ncbi:hypothetical protein BP6252_12882 [Coleophoma cylindrospora]|uniref:Xylanolytic transcriptional activator regulatory domain-containing protein n=1 Tax=Coleophoma cylindrospora TaxID=1849047 RepID=A0A3D8QD89_9HELO|nr:hypothetical protein BP6252_12882 [Coleophoma cylindrospora]
MPFGKNHYIKGLEDRVARLERFLADRDLLDQVPDHRPHFPQPSSTSIDGDDPAEPESRDEGRRKSSLTVAISPDTAGSGTDENEETAYWQKGVDSMSMVLRDLSLDANGGYIGASSHVSMGRLVDGIVKGKEQTRIPKEDSRPVPTPRLGDDIGLDFADMIPGVADRLLIGWLKHISTRYPVLHSPWVRALHVRRDHITDHYEKCILHLVYASGGRFLETTGETGPYFPERHHDEALKYLDEVLHFHDIRSVVTLILLGVFCLRAPAKGPGAWTYVGLAMRIAIDIGLHRQTYPHNRLSFGIEMRKRIFWSCYTFDRQVSIPLGRPFAISDRDIDCEMPLDVDEAATDIKLLEKASKVDPEVVPATSTTLSSFLHVLRIRKIESKIQQNVYRVDQSTGVSDGEIDDFIAELDRWKAMIPLDSRRHVDSETVAFDGFSYYMVFYYKCLRLLLYPMISKPDVNPRFLKACAEACGGVTQTYKTLHQSLPVGYSLMALQTVFMAGLTLIYCTWISPEQVFSSKTNNDIHACSIVLFVITERWPGAKKYRDIFEVVKLNVIDLIAEGQHQEPRRAIKKLKGTLGQSIQATEMGDDSQVFSQIMMDMAGEPPPTVPFGSDVPGLFGPPALAPAAQIEYQPEPTTSMDGDLEFEYAPYSGFDSGVVDLPMPPGEVAAAGHNSLDFSNGFDLESYLSNTDFSLPKG